MNQIIVGDCLEVMPTLPDGIVRLIVTSPPYPGQKGDKRTVDEWLAWFLQVAGEMYRVLDDNGVAVININFKRNADGFADHRVFTDFPNCMKGFSLLDFYPFIKPNPAPNGANGSAVYADIPSWEPVFVFTKSPSARYVYFNPVRRPYKPKSFTSQGRAQKGYIHVNGGKEHAYAHPEGARQGNYLIISSSGTSRSGIPRAEGQSFPPKLPERFILQYTEPGDLVLDPFAGVGTTCRVAQLLNRRYIGIELLEREAQKAREWLIRPYQSQIAAEVERH